MKPLELNEIFTIVQPPTPDKGKYNLNMRSIIIGVSNQISAGDAGTYYGQINPHLKVMGVKFLDRVFDPSGYHMDHYNIHVVVKNKDNNQDYEFFGWPHFKLTI